MQTLEIQVPDDKTNIVKEFLMELGVKIKVKRESKIPNAETIAAIVELKAGKGVIFNSVEDLFNSI